MSPLTRHIPLVFAAVIVGIVVLLYRQEGRIKVDSGVDLDDLLTLFVSVVLFYFWQLRYSESQQQRVYKQTLLQEAIRQCHRSAEVLNRTYLRAVEQQELRKATRIRLDENLKALSCDLDTVKTGLEESSTAIEKRAFNKVSDSFSQLRKCMYADPYPKSLDQNSRREQRKSYLEIRRALIRLSLTIGK